MCVIIIPCGITPLVVEVNLYTGKHRLGVYQLPLILTALLHVA